jgi:hypothetical protein
MVVPAMRDVSLSLPSMHQHYTMKALEDVHGQLVENQFARCQTLWRSVCSRSDMPGLSDGSDRRSNNHLCQSQ